MIGSIKFYNSQKDYGYIVVSGRNDVHFTIKAVVDDDLCLREGNPVDVELDSHQDETKRGAKFVRGTPESERTRVISCEIPIGEEKDWFYNWAYFVTKDFEDKNGNVVKAHLPQLAAMALSENWSFNRQNEDDNLSILWNYLKYSFVKLIRDGEVLARIGQTETFAAFNTGLVTSLYEPIYAFFEKNDRGEKDWKFISFCQPGAAGIGKKLTGCFNPLPAAPSYFQRTSDLVLDVEQKIWPDIDHIIDDGISRGRFPSKFLEFNLPPNFEWQDLSAMDRQAKKLYLKNLAEAIQNNPSCKNQIKNRIEDAIKLAKKRARWNYKTAIPQYYPVRDEMSLLIPLSLVDDERADIALVVVREESGSYQGPTALTLEMAYNNARLVCRPDSDWLTPTLISESNDEDDDYY